MILDDSIEIDLMTSFKEEERKPIQSGIKEIDTPYLEALDIIKNFDKTLIKMRRNINSALDTELHSVTKVRKLEELPQKIRNSIIKDSSFVLGLNALFALGFSIVTTVNIELLLMYLPLELLILNGNGVLRELRNVDFKDRKEIISANQSALLASDNARKSLEDAYQNEINKIIELRKKLIDYKNLSNLLDSKNEEILDQMINELSEFIERKQIEKRTELYDAHLLMEY